ncbi:cell division cycle protein 16 homolog [Colias croceus]|uniref:cell division cycle protein 16 homolog n=1 Tax=Colias crocea TaxID=72248 RepID=UPI001E27BC15|nr:cell division cycle protein 16 homolog [Colias croceus]
MAKAESCPRNNVDCLNVDFMRSLVKQYSELGQWTSAFFWADAAAASSGLDTPSGDDIWLLASTLLAKGELHRAAHAITSRGLHTNHLLCLGVAMRAFITAKEPSTALNLMEECFPALLEPRNMDQTHNRALAGVLVWQAKALTCLERREAAIEALTSALRADVACFEALDLLLEQHALTPSQENELIESLPINNQLNAAEAALLRVAYRERLLRYAPIKNTPTEDDSSRTVVELARARSITGLEARGRRLAACGEWEQALKVLDGAGPWACADVRVACLVELKRSAELFAFAHTLVDAYPLVWTSWFAVGCYYYLIGKNEFARRYLSKACSLEPSAGCVWLTYGHSFAADNEHDQAIAAYFKASQLMPGSYLPPLYVGVECSLLNNINMCERFLTRAAILHSNAESPGETAMDDSQVDKKCRWERIKRCVTSAAIAHEAGAGAYAAGDCEAARALWLRALHLAGPADQLKPCWAATLDAIGHAVRALGSPSEAATWHARALALRPARGASLAARGLCLALSGQTAPAADALHAALAKEPDNVVAAALLDAVVERLDLLNEEEVPQFPFPPVTLSLPPPSTPVALTSQHDVTNTSDMSMSFD